MTALIDADSLIYKAGFTFESKDTWNQLEIECGIETDPEITISADLQLAKNAIDAILENIAWNTGADTLELWLTAGDNFRYSVKSDYKHNRKASRKPQHFGELWKYLISEYGAKVATGYEADDVVVYLKTKDPDNYTLCAIDKDVIYQTEGTHYNYNKDEFITITKDFTDYFQHFQALAGDVTDGYIGCKGCGLVQTVKTLGFPSTCKAILVDILKKGKVAQKSLENLVTIEPVEDRWKAVVEQFESKGFTKEDAIIQERLASMKQLREDEEGNYYIELFKEVE